MSRDPLPKPSITAVLEELGGRPAGPDRGGWGKATCPIHEDKSPSASINEDACRFHCFVCDFSGDAIDLVMAVNGVTWGDAVKYIRENFEGEASDNDSTGGSSLHPSRKGKRAGRNNFSAPWLRL